MRLHPATPDPVEQKAEAMFHEVATRRLEDSAQPLSRSKNISRSIVPMMRKMFEKARSCDPDVLSPSGDGTESSRFVPPHVVYILYLLNICPQVQLQSVPAPPLLHPPPPRQECLPCGLQPDTQVDLASTPPPSPPCSQRVWLLALPGPLQVHQEFRPDHQTQGQDHGQGRRPVRRGKPGQPGQLE